MNCKICDSTCNLLFEARILLKYGISYFKCPHCGFIQTETPYWLKEAYESAITSLDLGYVSRNLMYRDIVTSVIKKKFNQQGCFLDYGGGYGLFVRLMRDVGFDYYRQDEYCENIFSKEFDINDIESKSDFELLTAFEVFEHLDNPLVEIERMLKHSDSILFSTSLQPSSKKIESVVDWEYFAPETGQHIAFYTEKSLLIIAQRYHLNLYSDKGTLHLLTRKKMGANIIQKISDRHYFINKKILGRYFWNKKSLISKDVELVRKKIIARNS